MNEAIQQLLDKQEITELVLRYCRFVDRRNYEGLKTLYHVDGIDDHSGMFYGGGDDYVEWLKTMLPALEGTSHQVFNHLIVVDGDSAEGEVYCQAFHKDSEGNAFVIGGRYLDKYTKASGHWQFLYRKTVFDWQQNFKACDSGLENGANAGHSGQDPSDSYFKLLNRA